MVVLKEEQDAYQGAFSLWALVSSFFLPCTEIAKSLVYVAC